MRARRRGRGASSDDFTLRRRAQLARSGPQETVVPSYLLFGAGAGSPSAVGESRLWLVVIGASVL
jgi:hypothetical protein